MRFAANAIKKTDRYKFMYMKCINWVPLLPEKKSMLRSMLNQPGFKESILERFDEDKFKDEAKKQLDKLPARNEDEKRKRDIAINETKGGLLLEKFKDLQTCMR